MSQFGSRNAGFFNNSQTTVCCQTICCFLGVEVLDSGAFSTVRCGVNNCASGDYAAALGGRCSTASAPCSFIGGGCCNLSSCNYGVVTGGQENTSSGYFSVVGGGAHNLANSNSSTVAGGQRNNAACASATVSGGRCNTASHYSTTISGGFKNTASGVYATVSGGYLNNAIGSYALVAGGNQNAASGCSSTVSGGFNSLASGIFSVVAGGRCNTSNACYSSIAGGQSNTASGGYSFVGGGCSNFMQGFAGFIGGGNCNNICNATCGCLAYGAVVAGGVGNNTTGGTWVLNNGRFTVAPTICNAGIYSAVGGGFQNVATSTYSTASGGYQNTSSGQYSFVGGGCQNTASGRFAAVSGGGCNLACQCAVVSGGRLNTASGVQTTISGGYQNVASGQRATVGGGCGNTASGYCSGILGGCGNTVSHCKSFAIGSGLTSSQVCTTFVNCLSAANLTTGCGVCVGTNGVLVNSSGGGTPSLTATQIAFGDGSNLMTSSSDFIYDGYNFNAGQGGKRYIGGDPNNLRFGDIDGYSADGSLLGIESNGISYFDNTNHDLKLGINTSTPSVALDVVGSSKIGYGGSVVQLGDWNGDNNGTYLKVDDGANVITLNADNGGTNLIVTGGGSPSVLVSTLSGTGTRAVLADGSGVLSAPVSDRSVKDSIKTLDYGLNTLLKLKPVSFYYKSEYKNFGTLRQVGFIAQDVQKVMPNSVYKNQQGKTKGKLGINKEDIIPVLVLSVQQLSAKVDALEKLNHIS